MSHIAPPSRLDEEKIIHLYSLVINRMRHWQTAGVVWFPERQGLADAVAFQHLAGHMEARAAEYETVRRVGRRAG